MKLINIVLVILFFGTGCKNDSAEENRFHENWGISPKEGAFKMDDWIVWGGSVIKADDGKYFMLAKCMNESITGEHGAGFLATSSNGIEWKISNPPMAYSRTVELSDGTKREMPKLERPQVLFENGKPTHVFFATRNEEGEIFNLVRPLKTVVNQE